MRQAHEVSKVRVAEGELMAKLPAGALMQRAAAGLASVCAALLGRVYGSRVVVLAGSGDNGGDALYAAAHLARRGAAVIAVAAGSRVHEDGAAALRASGGRVVTRSDPAVERAITRAGLILDGMLGIGGKGGLREPYATLAGLAARSAATVVAVDLPSGVDADTGAVDGPAVRADVTVTFGTWKPGLLVDPGAGCAGVVELVDIGLEPYLGPPDVVSAQAADVAAMLPSPTAESDKYRRGVTGVVSGSEQFTGAAVLSVGGAIRGGAGMVRFISAQPAADVVRQWWPEAVISVLPPEPATGGGSRFASVTAEDFLASAGRVQAWVAGPGMGTGDDAAELLRAVLRTDVPVLVDADGLTVLAAHLDLLPRAAPTLITPHAGELARLTGVDRGDIEAQRLRHARAAARQLGVTVLLKGSTTVICSPPDSDEHQAALINSTGTPWLATAGTGDVLSGLAGSLLAQGLDPAGAALAAAFLHGVAARRAAAGDPDGAVPDAGTPGDEPAGDAASLDGAPIGAADVVRALPGAIRAIRA
jgi:ADP-dependent NAD(P)H-hydrate dehydratase / NAD(P)H-hydrate epimerase